MCEWYNSRLENNPEQFLIDFFTMAVAPFTHVLNPDVMLHIYNMYNVQGVPKKSGNKDFLAKICVLEP